MTQAFYRPSGQVSALIVPTLIAALALALPGALAYAWVGARAPWLLGVLTIWPFALWLGCMAKFSCIIAKVRNPLIMKEFGVVLACWAWAAQWVFWIVFMSYPDADSMPGSSILIPLADLFAEPLAPLRALEAALAEIDWGKDADEAVVSVFCWLLELGILVVSTLMAGVVQARKPFCETSGRWAFATRLPFKFAADHVVSARSHLVAHPDRLLVALVPAKSPKRYAMVTLFRGRDAAYLSVDVIESWLSGKRQTCKRDRLIQYCLVPESAADGFLARVHRQMRSDDVAKPVSMKTRFLWWLEDHAVPSG